MTTPRESPSLSGALRLTWVTDHLEHVLRHGLTDEPIGTWIGLACPDHNLPTGADVDEFTLQHLAWGEIADLVWEAPEDLAEQHGQLCHAAIHAYQAGNHEAGERLWREAQTLWATASASSREALKLIQHAGLARFSPHKPQRWVIASFDHRFTQHAVDRPHIHNIVIPALTTTGSA